MKIAIFGAGALGGYFGGRLQQAGEEVAFIARGDHLKALQRNGLTIESAALGDAHIQPVQVTDNPADIGPVDVILFLVKLYDTEAAARSLTPLLGQDTYVVSFQNGIDGWRLIGDVIGMERVLGGISYIFADVREPGVIRHSSPIAKLIFGEFDGGSSERSKALERVLVGAGIDASSVDDINVRIWEKFVALSALSAVTTLTRLSIGQVLENEHCRKLFREALAETAKIGLKKCPGLAADIADRQMAFAESLPYGMRASMLDDLERGKRLELDHLSGAVAQLGQELGIETPVHAVSYRALHPYVKGG